MSERITRIGPCGLTTEAYSDGPSLGYWVAATCSEYCDAVNAHGGLTALRVWSGFTNMEWSDLGAPYMFTEWGTEDHPVAADGGPPEARGFGHPCLMTHAVFVPLTGDCSEDCLEGCAYPGQFSECAPLQQGEQG